MDILWNLILVIAGFVLLVKGADFFVDGAASVATKFGIPQIVVGLTIVAMGTSAPEAAVSIGSAIKGSNGISIGNVLGSNIFNILIVLGVTACICTLHVKKSVVRIDLPVMIGVSILLLVLGMVKPELNYITGILFWAILIVYIIYLIIYAKKSDETEEEEYKILSPIKIVLYIFGGIAAIVLGSDVAVDGATAIAKLLGVSDRIIGLTIVAFGTSLPELMTSITAARKGNADLAVGNVVGSNLFNILFVLGTTCLIQTVTFSASFLFDGILSVVAAVLLWFLVFKKGELKRFGGILMLLIYAAYLVYLLVA
ncbi:MAG: calcium/sodium antiporter [Lachnospira sp.]|nr:calcium/sodium antiporter [Lachnospira sp.]